MITVGSIMRVLHGTRRGHLGRVVAVNFAGEKVTPALMRYRVRFDHGESEWYESAMIEEWVVRTRTNPSTVRGLAPRSGSGRGDHSSNAA